MIIVSDNIFDAWFGDPYAEKRWMKEFENKIYELEAKTGLSRKELMKVAKCMDELNIVSI